MKKRSQTHSSEIFIPQDEVFYSPIPILPTFDHCFSLRASSSIIIIQEIEVLFFDEDQLHHTYTNLTSSIDLEQFTKNISMTDFSLREN